MPLERLKPTWLLRRKASALLARAERDPSPANLQALDGWRKKNARHSTLLNSGDAVLRQSLHLSPSILTEERSRAQASHERARPRFALAASIALCLICAGALYLVRGGPNQPIEAVLLTTSVGEIRQVHLSDGSNVTLDTGTSVRVDIRRNHRQAVVDHGRARFAIASSGAPFTIRTATAAVRLKGGVIDVSSGGADTDIVLIAGKAQIGTEAKDNRHDLVIDAPASVSTNGGAVRALPRQISADWPSGRLSFANTRLADVVATANRYTKVQIGIGDPSISDLRVTGVFKAGDAEGLSKSLAAAFRLRIEKDGRGDLILRSEPQR